jgi:hypothetical protein
MGFARNKVGQPIRKGMPRLQRQTATKPSLAQELRAVQALYAELLAAEQTALERARDIGKVLQPLPVPERNALCRAAEFSERLGRLYIQIYENWRAILAARCQSIREADRLLRKPKREQARPFLFDEDLGPHYWPETIGWFKNEALNFEAWRTAEMKRIEAAAAARMTITTL